MTSKEINITIALACGWTPVLVPLEDDLGPIGDLTITKWKRPSNPKHLVDPISEPVRKNKLYLRCGIHRCVH